MSKSSDTSKNYRKLQKDESSVNLIKEKGLLCKNIVLSQKVTCSKQHSLESTESGLSVSPPSPGFNSDLAERCTNPHDKQ